MHQRNYSLEILVNGRPVQEFQKSDKIFIEGRKSTEYSIRFRNNTPKKVMGVFSVDGLDVLKGEVASESTVGYIIDPYSSLDIKGFRIDTSSVAAFKFGDTEKSYSNTQGVAVTNPVTKETTYEKTTKNNGTIGVRVYEEAVASHDYHGYYTPTSRTVFQPFSFYDPNNVINFFSYSGCLPQQGSGFYVGGSLSLSGCNSPITSQQMFCTGTAYFNNVYSSQPSLTTSIHKGRNRTHYQSDCLYAGPEPVIGSSYSAPLQSVNEFGELSMLDKIKIDNSLNPPTFDIGTSLGSKLQDKVKEVEFNRKKEFVELVIYYASRESLVQFGIDFSNTKQIAAWPKAFEDKKQFCKMPVDYKG